MAVVVFAAVLGPAGIAMAEAPTLTLAIGGPHNGSVTNSQPIFSGGTTDSSDVVTLKIYEGIVAGGLPAQTLTTQSAAVGGTWSLGPTAALTNGGVYTAQATQTNQAEEKGESPELTFTVNTASPTVTLNQPPSPSKNTTPSFTGSASDTTKVTVHIFAGPTATGSEVSAATANGTGGGWSSNNEGPLSSGQYTAMATQLSSLGNPPGTSEPVTFTVNTSRPIVTLTAPPTPSNNKQPSFTGLASDTTHVIVHIHEGSAEGPEVAKAEATTIGGEGNWTSSKASPELGNGEYAAIATQQSSLGNPAGVSLPVTFKVDTKAPTVALNRPPSPSNNTTPSFIGFASEKTPVTIQIYEGTSVEGTPVATATATGTGGAWTSGAASPALPSGQYTASAIQQSAIGNHEGTSPSVTFTIDTTPPLVTLTFPPNSSTTIGGSQLVGGSAGTTQGDKPAITIRLYAGSTVGTEPVQELTVPAATGGAWSATFGGLSAGAYTVQARQSDEAGNVGASAPVTFTVVASVVAPPIPPTASFKWFPSVPQTGEPVSLVSSSTDVASPITDFAWAPTSNAPFQLGGAVLTTSFSTPGGHVVRLRVTNASGLSSLAAETINVVGTRTPLMQPFPVVRIAGTETASGVKLRLLAVQQAPRGARITVKCRGRGCPIKSASRVATSGKVGLVPVEFHRFERTLRAGVVLDVRVSKPGEIGKYTHFVVRRGKLPERLDMCLDPAGATPLVCPSS